MSGPVRPGNIRHTASTNIIPQRRKKNVNENAVYTEWV